MKSSVDSSLRLDLTVIVLSSRFVYLYSLDGVKEVLGGL